MKKELENIKKRIIPILKKYNVKKAGIFGSYVRGEQKKNSDVDLLVEVDKKVSLIGFIRLKNILEKAVKRKVDLVEYDCIRQEIRQNVLGEEVPIIRQQDLLKTSNLMCSRIKTKSKDSLHEKRL